MIPAVSYDTGQHQTGGPKSKPRNLSERLPPHDPDAELALVGHCLLSPQDLDELRDLVQPESFYSDAARRVWEAMLDLLDSDGTVDLVNVATWLRDRDRLERVGGSVFIAELASLPTLANPASVGQIVADKARLRKAIAVCQSFAAQGYGDVHDVDPYINRLEAAVFDIGEKPDALQSPPLKALLGAQIEKIKLRSQPGQEDYAPTSLDALNGKFHGWTDAFYYVLAARPGQGKTALAIQEIRNHAKRTGKATVFFSLEQPRPQVVERMLCQEAGVDNGDMKTGKMHGGQWGALAAAAERLTRLPIAIEDDPCLTVAQLKSRTRRALRRLQREHNNPELKLGLIVVDYIQLMESHGRHGSREEEVSQISKGIRAFGKSLNVPSIILSQLSRANTKPPRPPILSDLRESGQIEQDAQVVIFIHDKTLIVAKCRDGGRVGTSRVDFDGPTLTFSDPKEGWDTDYDAFEGR